MSCGGGGAAKEDTTVNKRHEEECMRKHAHSLSWACEHSNSSTSCPIVMKFDVEQLTMYVDAGKNATGSARHQKKFKSFVTFMEAAQKMTFS